MTRMRPLILAAGLTLAATVLPAQTASPPQAAQTTPAQPPVSIAEIETWIDQHLDSLNVPPSSVPMKGGKAVNDETGTTHVTIYLVFQGCLAWLTEEGRTDWSKKSKGKYDFSWDEFNTAVLDLSKGIADKIGVAPNPKQDDMLLSIPFSQPFPVRSETDYLGGTYSDIPDKPDVSTAPASTIILPFANENTANRQAKAWHDAIVACGGKAAPDNLY